MINTKLRASLYCKLATLYSLAVWFTLVKLISADIFVDNLATAPGIGLKLAPFSTFRAAIDLSIDKSTSLLQESTSETTITLQPTAEYYRWSNFEIVGPASASFVVQANSATSLSSKDDCEMLPKVLFTNNDSSSINGIDRVAFKSLWLYLNASETISEDILRMESIGEITFENVCISELSSATPISDKAWMSVSLVNSLDLTRIFAKKTQDHTWLDIHKSAMTIETFSLLFPTENQLGGQPIIKLDNEASDLGMNASISGLTLECEARNSTQMSTSNFFSFSNFATLLINNWTIQGCSQIEIIESMFSFTNLVAIDVNGLLIDNSYFKSNHSSIFLINNLERFEIDSFKFTNCHTSNETDERPQGRFILLYAFRVQNLRSPANNKDPETAINSLSNIVVANNTGYYFQVGMLSGNYTKFNINNIEIDNNYLIGFLFKFKKFHKYDSIFAGQVEQRNDWIFSNVIIRNNTFRDFQLLYLDYSSDVVAIGQQIGEFDEFQVQNMQLYNNTFGQLVGGQYEYKVNFIENEGFRVHLKDCDLTQNTFVEYVFIYTYKRIASVLVENTHFSQLVLNKSAFIQENFRGVYFSFVDFSFYDSDDSTGSGWIYAFYRVTGIYNCSFSNIILLPGSYFFDAANPYVFIENNTFIDMRIDNAYVFRVGGFLPLQVDSELYTFYERNQEWEAQLFDSSPWVMANFNATHYYEGSLKVEEIVYQLRIVGNEFRNADDYVNNFMFIMSYDFSNSAVLVYGNKFNNCSLSGASFFQVESVSFLEFRMNHFYNFTGDGYAIRVKNLENDRALVVQENNITRGLGSGMLSVEIDRANLVYVNHNLVTETIFERVAIDIVVLRNEGSMLLRNNTFSNCSVRTSPKLYGRIGLIYIETPNEVEMIVLQFYGNIFERVDFIKANPFMKGISSNNLITFLLGNSTLEIKDCILDSIDARYDGNQLTISAETVVIENSTFKNLGTYEQYGAVYVLTQSVTITDCKFVNSTGSSTTVGGAIYIENDYNLPRPIVIDLRMNIFINNTAVDGGLLYVKNSQVNFKSERNYFQNNFGYQGAAIQFYNITFSNFELKDSEIILDYDQSIEIDFLEVRSCKGEAVVENAFIGIVGQQKGQLVFMKRSPDLVLKTSQIDVITADTVTALESQRSKHYSTGLVPVDSKIQLEYSDAHEAEERRLLLDGSAQNGLQSMLSLSVEDEEEQTGADDSSNGYNPQRSAETNGSRVRTNNYFLPPVANEKLVNVSFSRMSFLTLDSGSAEISDSNFDGYNLFERGLLEILCYSDVKIRVDNSSFQQMKFAARSTGSPQWDYQYANKVSVAYFAASALDNVLCNHEVNITRSTFANIYSNGSGCVVNDQSDGEITINIFNNSFSDLQSRQGSAINSISPTDGSVVRIIDSNFTNNQAFGYGGCIFNTFSLLDIKGCSFINNSAMFTGGAIYSEKLDQWNEVWKSNHFQNNSLKRDLSKSMNTGLISGPNIASNPRYIRVTFDHDDLQREKVTYEPAADESHFSLMNLTTYSVKNLRFYFELKDVTNFTVEDNSDDIVIKMNFRSETDELQVATGSECYESEFMGCSVTPILVQLYGVKGNVTTVSVSYTSAEVQLSTIVYLHLRDCIPGEVYDQKYQTCTYCERGKFSIDPYDHTKCQLCPEEAICDGGDHIAAKPGYWRNETSPIIK